MTYYGNARTQNGKVRARVPTHKPSGALGPVPRANPFPTPPWRWGRLLQGVTIPSQIRYVHYYGEMLNKKLVYEEKVLFLKKIIIHTVPRIAGGVCGT